MQLCLFNYVHVIYFKSETWNPNVIDLAAAFPCLRKLADSVVLQLTMEGKLGDNLTQDMCLCPKISQAGKLRVIENYFQSFLSQDKSD